MKAIIEIPFGCNYKYEHNKERNILVLDRPLNQVCPQNYGYIPDTLSEDGDPLDVFVICSRPIIPLTEVKIDIMGIMYCEDNGFPDHKIIASLKYDNEARYWNSDLNNIESYLKTYKEGFKYNLYSNTNDAIQEIELCKQRFLSKS